VLSLVTSIAAGVVLPLMTIIFGNAVGEFNKFSAGDTDAATFQHLILDYVWVHQLESEKSCDLADLTRLWYIYLFVAKLVLSYISTLSICIAAIRTTRSLRQAFLDSLLRKEIWHFDSKDPSSVAVLVTTNGARINKGIADKFAFLIQYVAMFFAAFIVALARQWKLTLITMSIIPGIMVIISICVPIEAAIESRVMRMYSQGGSIAQEAISTIKNIHAFWAQGKMVEKYDNLLQQAHTEGKKKSILYGILFSAEYFFVFSGVALSFWKGYRMFASGEIDGIGPVFT
jgi:ATP-binding cassette subfamily B (MDR/TAP) protein 1